MHQPNILFIGIGGIGMSAIARYFITKGTQVFGYDKTPSSLTTQLIAEGADIIFDEHWPDVFQHLNPNNCMVIYTPAIPSQNNLLKHAEKHGFVMLKRSEALGLITRSEKSIGVAGTHGKSTTSTMLAYLLSNTNHGCNAFLGAISTNFNSNFVTADQASWTVVEADEFDRSFLQLSPFASIVTTVDPDHLDVYTNEEKFVEGFRQYTMKIDPQGVLVLHHGIKLPSICRQVTYSLDTNEAHYFGYDLSETEAGISFSLRTPTETYHHVVIGIHGRHNAENAIGCLALCQELGIDVSIVLPFFSYFKGIKRRFEIIYQHEKLTYIDDYAHHPTEIRCLIQSVREMFPNKKITGVFQPHLFTRTQDFGDGFALELSKLDRLILLPIYPARELPINGIDSTWLLSKIKLDQKMLVQPSELLQQLRSVDEGVLLTIGAGDIDRFVDSIHDLLLAKEVSS